ncbi:MAG: thioesterase family protein [Dehalococcoidia bacterium]
MLDPVGTTYTYMHVVGLDDIVTEQGPQWATLEPVFATAKLVAFAEFTCGIPLRAALKPNQTVVGASISARHLLPTLIGARLTFVATLKSVYGKGYGYEFDVKVLNDLGDTAGEVSVACNVINKERFRERACRIHNDQLPDTAHGGLERPANQAPIA